MRRRIPPKPALLLYAAALSSEVANASVIFILPWLIFAQGAGAKAVGIVLAATIVPTVIAAPASGWLADRFGRRRVSIGADLLSASSTGIFLVLWWLLPQGEIPLWAIGAVAMWGATFDPAGNTARRALIPDVARSAQIDADDINGIYAALGHFGWLLGPVMAAGLVSVLDPALAMAAPTGLALIAALAVISLSVTEVVHSTGPIDGDGDQADARPDTEPATEPQTVAFWDGARYLLKDPVLRTVTFAIVLLAMAYIPLESVMLPSYFAEQDQPGRLGVLLGFMGLGGLISASGYGWITRRISDRWLLRFTMLGTALFLLPMSALVPGAWLFAAGFAVGMAWGPFEPFSLSILQARVPPEAHGRVIGIQEALFAVLSPAATALAGFAVDAFGAERSIWWLGAVVATLCVLVPLQPALRSLPDRVRSHPEGEDLPPGGGQRVTKK